MVRAQAIGSNSISLYIQTAPDSMYFDLDSDSIQIHSHPLKAQDSSRFQRGLGSFLRRSSLKIFRLSHRNCGA